MADETKPAARPKQDSPEVAALKFKEQQLTDKIARVSEIMAAPGYDEGALRQQGHEYAVVLQQAENQLAEVRAALKTTK